jgi:hypothetical protein
VIDVNQVLTAYLKTTGTALYTLCGTRIWVATESETFKNEQAAIVLGVVGGRSDQYLPDREIQIQAKCYGGTKQHGPCNAVYAALFDLLHGSLGPSEAGPKTTAHGVLVGAYETIPGQSLEDPDTRWPFVLAQFSVTVRSAS